LIVFLGIVSLSLLEVIFLLLIVQHFSFSIGFVLLECLRKLFLIVIPSLLRIFGLI
jgi:hypothetical protein